MIAILVAISSIGQTYCPTCPTATPGYAQPTTTYTPIIHQGVSTYTYPQHVVYNTPLHLPSSQIIENQPATTTTIPTVVQYQPRFPVLDPSTLPFSINGFEFHVDSNGSPWMRKRMGNSWVYIQQDGTSTMPLTSNGAVAGTALAANYGLSVNELRQEPREVLTTNDPGVGRILGAEERPLSFTPDAQTATGVSASSTSCPDGKCPTDPKALDPQTLMIAVALLGVAVLAAVFKQR